MSGSSQRSLAELVRADEHPDACPNGDTRYEGEADLRAGDLCCWYSYLVMLPGGRVHRVAYAREDGVSHGRCD